LFEFKSICFYKEIWKSKSFTIRLIGLGLKPNRPA
jgi:hypothetical protein